MKQHCFPVMKSFMDLDYFHKSSSLLGIDYERKIGFYLKHVEVIMEGI